MEKEKLWKVQDLADYLALTEQGVRRGIERGTVPPPLRVGARLRWHPREVERWLGLARASINDTAPPEPRRRGPGRPRKEVRN